MTGTRRLKIAFVVLDYNRVEGHSRYVAELAERYAGAHDVHVFANSFDGVPPGIAAHRVPALGAYTLLKILTFALPASLMVRGGFDIVHAQGFVLWRANIITAHIANARWMEARRGLAGGRLGWRERLFGAVVVPLERHTLRDPDATVIAVSSQLRRDLSSFYGRTDDVVVVPHGVDQHQFRPCVRDRFRGAVRAEHGIPDDRVVFLYVGDMRKGFASAVRALAAVPAAHLVGVSRGASAEYVELARELGVAGRLTIVPGSDQIERYYGAADALVLPTPYDAFGMVITEAMACALPVITTPSAGAAELIVHGVHGLLVESPADVGGFAQAMSQLADDPAGRERMGAAAAARMREHTWDRVADRTLAVYQEHLARRQAGGR